VKCDDTQTIKKAEVYEHYRAFCIHNNIQPTSSGVFGKLVKKIFPRIVSIRRGPRGNTKHYYRLFGFRTPTAPFSFASPHFQYLPSPLLPAPPRTLQPISPALPLHRSLPCEPPSSSFFRIPMQLQPHPMTILPTSRQSLPPYSSNNATPDLAYPYLPPASSPRLENRAYATSRTTSETVQRKLFSSGQSSIPETDATQLPAGTRAFERNTIQMGSDSATSFEKYQDRNEDFSQSFTETKTASPSQPPSRTPRNDNVSQHAERRCPSFQLLPCEPAWAEAALQFVVQYRAHCTELLVCASNAELEPIFETVQKFWTFSAASFHPQFLCELDDQTIHFDRCFYEVRLDLSIDP
jgi:hypothetical protein